MVPGLSRAPAHRPCARSPRTLHARAGGVRLARDPSQISVGEVVRLVEKDFAVVACHDEAVESDCAIVEVCNLRRVLHRAVDAFMYELDKVTLADAAAAPPVVARLLGLETSRRGRIGVVTGGA